MKFKKLIILLCMVILMLPNICYAEEENKEYNWELPDLGNDGTQEKTEENKEYNWELPDLGNDGTEEKAEDNKEYNWELPDLGNDGTQEKTEEKQENVEVDSEEAKYQYFFYDKSLIKSLCKNNGSCKFYHNKSNEIERFSLNNHSTIEEVRNTLKNTSCDGKSCYLYVKKNYCNNWKNRDMLCQSLQELETSKNSPQKIVSGFECGGAEVLRVLKFVYILIDLVFLIVPVGLIVMVMVDFTKNVIAGKEDEMKKNANLAIKRVGFTVVLFLIGPIVSFVINFLGNLGVDYATCIKIAREEDDLWKYTIDWDYYPYGGNFPESSTSDYVKWNRYDEDGNVIGTVTIYKDGRVEEN